MKAGPKRFQVYFSSISTSSGVLFADWLCFSNVNVVDVDKMVFVKKCVMFFWV